MARRARRPFSAKLRYLAALLARFRTTVAMALAMFGVVPLLFCWLYVRPDGGRVAFGEALHHVYFLLFGQPSLPYIRSVPVEAMNMLIPPLGLALVVDGVVRFAYLFFAKHRREKEWVEVMSQTLEKHVIVCGAGRVGYRVTEQLLALGHEVVVIEKREDAAFVAVLRDRDVPVTIDDIKSPHCLDRVNVKRAAAIVAATDDDLANLNVALDARRLHPAIRVVIRLFDDDLVARIRAGFELEAFSSSALAAPALALAALDPRIVHSFQVGGHLMVVSVFHAGAFLTGMTVAQVRDRHGGLTLAVRHGESPERLHPKGETAITAGDALTIQATYESYVALRALTDAAK
jgi:voltage-gated potassium channel